MTLTAEQLSKRYVDHLCREADYKPKEIYSLMQILEDDPDLKNTMPEPLIGMNGPNWKIRADYAGSKPFTSWEPNRHIEPIDMTDEYAKEYFKELGERTGIDFSNAKSGGDISIHSQDQDIDYFTAQTNTPNGKTLQVVIKQTTIKNQPK